MISSSLLVEDQPGSVQTYSSYETFPHQFFKHMLRLEDLNTIPTLSSIAQAILSYKLVIITDGSHNYVSKQGSQAMALTNGTELLWLNDGPCMGHGMTMNPKRAKLCGLTSALYLALWVCLNQTIHYGSIAFLCNSKGAIATLNRIAGGLPLKKPVNDMDLTVECHEIIKKLPIKVKFKWLPGHKRADDLLSKIQRTVQPAAKQRNSENSTPTSILPPSYKIAISYKGQLIPTNLRKIVQKVAHTTDLQETVMKNTGWTLSQFKEINWLAHERAFLSLGHFHQISICKLVHNLICTNNTQKRYYGKPDLCPRCEVGSESMSQLLCCPSKYSSNHRRIAQEELVSQLNNIGTPERITSTILYGLSSFVNQTNGKLHGKPTTFGSIVPQDMLATQCITSQTALGWDQFFMATIPSPLLPTARPKW